jgi:ankyrin repeat protein
MLLTAFAAFGQPNDARLIQAASADNSAAVQSLLRQGSDVNAIGADGTTPLHWVVRADDLETAGMLLRAGAKPNAADRYGIAPLYLACSNGNAAMIAGSWTPARTQILPLLQVKHRLWRLRALATLTQSSCCSITARL